MSTLPPELSFTDLCHRLATAGASSCNHETAPVLGAIVDQSPLVSHTELKKRRRRKSNLVVLAMADDSLAQRAGLLIEDKLLSINDSKFRGFEDFSRSCADPLKKN